MITFKIVCMKTENLISNGFMLYDCSMRDIC